MGFLPAKGRRPWPFFLHNLAGLQLSLFLGFVFATGTIATLSYEIEWLFLPKVRASVAPAGREPSWGTLWDAALAAYPQVAYDGIGRGGKGEESYLARVATGLRPDQVYTEVYIDPGNALVTGQSAGTTFPSLMRGLHYYLLAPTEIPFYAVTALGIVMLISLVTGLFVYKKFWRGFLRWPRFNKPARVWWGDLHRLLALWSLWFVAVIGITSVWYLVEGTGWVNWEPEAPSREAPPANATRDMPDGKTIDSWVAIAEHHMPELQISRISLPYEPQGYVTIQGQKSAWLVRERTNVVWIDPVNLRVVGMRDASHMPMTERWVHTADPLHFGSFYGLASKLIWAFFGLALVAIATSGAVIYAKRTSEASRRLFLQRPAVGSEEAT